MSGRVEEIDSDLLVPGDVLELESAAFTSTTTPSDGASGSGQSDENAAGGSGWKIPCDAVLVSGTCIVNESILTGECANVSLQYIQILYIRKCWKDEVEDLVSSTGESVPVSKAALPDLPDETFGVNSHSRHLLFCGTYLIQSRAALDGPPRAVVFRTGY